MDIVKLTVEVREERGNGPSRRLREAGRIPGVTYGKGKESTAVSFAMEDLKEAVAAGRNVVFELDFAGGKSGKTSGKSSKKAGSAKPRYAVIKEMQLHPTKGRVLHVDLHEVDLETEIDAAVPVELEGTPLGVKEGGVLGHERREVMVRALPANVPEVFRLDVSELMAGHHLSVADLVAPTGVVILDDPSTVLATVGAPSEVEEAVAAEVVEEAEAGSAEAES